MRRALVARRRRADPPPLPGAGPPTPPPWSWWRPSLGWSNNPFWHRSLRSPFRLALRGPSWSRSLACDVWCVSTLCMTSACAANVCGGVGISAARDQQKW